VAEEVPLGSWGGAAHDGRWVRRLEALSGIDPPFGGGIGDGRGHESSVCLEEGHLIQLVKRLLVPPGRRRNWIAYRLVAEHAVGYGNAGRVRGESGCGRYG
jgi:hypothetical protein